MEQAVTFQDAEGYTFTGILAAPDGETDRITVLCHGFFSNKNSKTNQALTALLIEQGIATFRFDFFGQGESKGPFERITVRTAVNQALAAMDLVAARGYRKIGLVGSSFGGLVAILAAAQFRTPPGQDRAATEAAGADPPRRGSTRPALICLALKCPVPDFPEMLGTEFGEDGMAEWKATDTIPNVIPGGSGRIKLRYAFYEDCVRHDGYAAAKVITTPTLIVQGEADEYVPLHQSRRLSEELKGKNVLVVLPGADHHFSNPEHFREMTTLLAQWVSDHLNTKDS